MERLYLPRAIRHGLQSHMKKWCFTWQGLRIVELHRALHCDLNRLQNYTFFLELQNKSTEIFTILL